MSYFNEDQQAWTRTLESLRPDQKCSCGWDRRGHCFGACYGHPEKGGAERKDEGKEGAVTDG